MLNHVLIILTGQTNSFVISDETLPFTFMTYNNLIMLHIHTDVHGINLLLLKGRKL